MLQIRNITRTILASMLAVMVAVSFYPATAFADTDYEAAYNQAKANTQAAYTEWKNAVSDMNAKYTVWQTAKTNYETASAAIASKEEDMNKKHRILDYATRKAMDDYSIQAYTAECGNRASNSEIKEKADTDTRIKNYIQSKTSHKDYNKLVQPAKNVSNCEYGVTTSASGNDDTNSLNWYQYCVYMGQSYGRLMLTLDYFDENNQFRRMNESFMKSNEYTENMGEFRGNVEVLVSPYLMVQATTNAPWNRGGHNALASYAYPGASAAQNLAFTFGSVDAIKLGKYTYTSSDPFHGLFYHEENNFKKGGWDAAGIGHYLNILGINTHGGMACTYGGTAVFEQDFMYNTKATGYTTTQYRNMINNRVGSELSAYNNAVTAYNSAINTAEDYADIKDDALDDYTDAQYVASQKEIAYNNAITAENTACQAWQEWLANQNQGGNTDPGTNPGTDPGTGSGDSPDPGTTPDPPVEPPTNTSQVTGITASATSATSFKVIWNAVSGVDSYNVYVDNGDETKKYSASSNSRAIPNCVTNETYLIQVSTVVDGEEGPKSNIYTFTLTYNTGGSTGGDTGESGGNNGDDSTIHSMELNSEIPSQVTGVTLTETPNNGNPIITVKWNSATNAAKYYVYVTSNNNTRTLTATASGYQVKNCKPSTVYNVKVSGVSSNGTEGQVSLGKNITTSAYTQPAPPKPTVGTPSITKTKVTKKSKKVDIWFSAAKNAKSYKVEIRRIYKLKGKKKIAVSSGWKAYNVTSPTKIAWVYKKKITAKQAKKYKGNANYKLTKSGKKYKLYHKENVAPVTATKLTRKSIYQVRVTAYNGSAHQTSTVKTFTIK